MRSKTDVAAGILPAVSGGILPPGPQNRTRVIQHSTPDTGCDGERRWLAFGTFNGKRGLVPENRIKMPAAWKAMVANGKIKHWQVYADWTEGCRIIEEDKKAG